MHAVTIRPADSTDVPEMARLWYEKTVMQQEFDQRFALRSDGQGRWVAHIERVLADSGSAVFVAERSDGLAGYIIVSIQPGPPGLYPEYIGIIADLTMDAHSQQGGAGRLLLQSVRDWLAAHRVTYILAYIPRRQAVEQAFWRALGATEWLDVLWMKL
jgi:hypothetical protein